MNGVVGAHALCQSEPRVIDVRRDDARGARSPADSNREDSDRAAPGDEYHRSRNLRGKHRVKGIPHRVVDAADVIGNLVGQMPDVRRGHGDVLGKAAVAIDADDPGERTDVRVARSAQQATTVNNVPLGGDTVALFHIGNETPDLHDIARKLVPHNEGRLAATLCPRVPVEDVNIGAADSRASHTNQNFVLSDPRLRDILQLETGCSGFLYQRFHEQLLR